MFAADQESGVMLRVEARARVLSNKRSGHETRAVDQAAAQLVPHGNQQQHTSRPVCRVLVRGGSSFTSLPAPAQLSAHLSTPADRLTVSLSGRFLEGDAVVTANVVPMHGGTHADCAGRRLSVAMLRLRRCQRQRRPFYAL